MTNTIIFILPLAGLSAVLVGLFGDKVKRAWKNFRSGGLVRRVDPSTELFNN